MVRTYIKKVKAATATADYAQAQAAFVTSQPYIDKMVNKGILHKNTAARIKSRLNAKVVALKA
jgi:small subunit ribosomal protein S20